MSLIANPDGVPSRTDPSSPTDLELQRLAALDLPAELAGGIRLERALAVSSTAVLFEATGGLFGEQTGICKVCPPSCRAIGEHEYEVLQLCARHEAGGVIRPLSIAPIEGRLAGLDCYAIALPALGGGDLYGWAAQRAQGRFTVADVLAIGQAVAGILRDLLELPTPVIQGDVRGSNFLFRDAAGDLDQLTAIDFDAAIVLPAPVRRLDPNPDLDAALRADVCRFGELLFRLTTGRDASPGDLDPATPNKSFNRFVERCISCSSRRDYLCFVDKAFWADLQAALEEERAKPHVIARVPRRRAARWHLVAAGAAAAALAGAVVQQVLR